jgi:hypothetical protein
MSTDWDISLDLVKACAKSWPDRPKLESFQWPFSQAALERCIDDAMEQYGRIVSRND